MAETTETKKPAAKKAAAPKVAAAAPVDIKTAPAKKPAAKKAPAAKAERTSGIRVTQIHSGAGRSKAQIGTLAGLGLGKLRRSKVLEDTPAVRGMIASVQHLVTMEVVG